MSGKGQRDTRDNTKNNNIAKSTGDSTLTLFLGRLSPRSKIGLGGHVHGLLPFGCHMLWESPSCSDGYA